MKKAIIIVSVILILVLAVALFININKPLIYGVEPYDEAETRNMLDAGFKINNRISVASYYYNSSGYSKYFECPECPKTRAFLIKSQEDFDKYFTDRCEYDDGFDFDNKMLVLLTFPTKETTHVFDVMDVNAFDGTLYIKVWPKPYKLGSDRYDEGRYTQRWFLLEMNKYDVTDVDFELYENELEKYDEFFDELYKKYGFIWYFDRF